MTWFLATILSSFAFAGGSIIEKYVVNEKTEPIYIALTSCTFSMIFGLLFALISGQTHIPNTVYPFLILGLASLLCGFANITFYQALKYSDISEFELFMRFTVVINIIGGYIFYAERYRVDQWIGVAIVLIGLGILSYHQKKLRITYGNAMAIITATLFGFETLLDKLVLSEFSSPMYTFFMFLGIITVLTPFVLYTWRVKKSAALNLVTTGKISIASMMYTANAILFYIAIQHGPVGLIGLVNQIQIPIVVLYGIWILRERENLGKKGIAMGCLLVGVYLLR
jgi:uncharacterized membrane protein